MDSSLPIGLFDSGVGGLTVLKALRELLPNENFVYLGDTARVPYGIKSRDTIVRYSIGAASKLASYGVKMIVIACNTAASAALSVLRKELAPIPVLGVIEPGAEAATNATRNGRICVVGTEATIRGQAYQKAIRRRMPKANVIGRACTLLVPLAEEGWLDGEITEKIIRRYLAEIFGEGAPAPDALLLGCTHFPLFMKPLSRIVGENVAIVDSASSTARAARKQLEETAMLNQKGGRRRLRLLTTDNPERFATAGSLFLGRQLLLEEIELVDLQG